MTRTTIGLSIALLAAGCSSSVELGGGGTARTATDTQLAAYAGGVSYPQDATAINNLAVTSTINQSSGAITVRNYTNETFYDPRLWVNQVYVLRLPTLAPQGSVTVPPDKLFDSAGNTLKGKPYGVITRVQLQTDDRLINVRGPQVE